LLGADESSVGVDAFVVRVNKAEVPAQTAVIGVLHAQFRAHTLAFQVAEFIEEVAAAAVDVAVQEKVGVDITGDAGEEQVIARVVDAHHAVADIRTDILRRVEIGQPAVLREEADTIDVRIRLAITITIRKLAVEQ